MSGEGGEPGQIVVLASGRGTNCQALIDACSSGELDAQIVAVVTNNENAAVIGRAEQAGIALRVVDHRGSDPRERARSDARLVEVISGYNPDLVVLAGWMRILGAEVAERFRIINLHPARPGEFAGIGAVERAYEAWVAGEVDESGVMVHWVQDEGVDVGPVLTTEVVAFRGGDSLDDFSARLHAVEHRLIVQGAALALRAIKS